ncbi:MAG TPA: M3 family oligoendopeptidase [Cyclobacteriaceae bacterium]|nr:M3 family oligoendopeptidase [Cyclobacteriaceae bacterium]HMV10598.1 M3 family oligoendopeptidase [Cyclobacteriaceae bacterium]HMV89918.1 M3 family oligoendopeptidase [Cyclobacteriaceae bacterium]HMX02585.1 M3 family oligoendopeptidase [Cyclobacteriaceae bacterium]HMX50916.1 M3 family oligoendopeptidase [Cyclobacteriaceae bacterium]
MEPVAKIERPKRKFLPENFSVTDWTNLKPYFDNLLARDLNSLAALRQWLHDRSELESVISEDLAWRYINMTRYTENQEYSKRYEDFVVNIQPQIAPVSDQLNKKAAASAFLATLEKEAGFDIMIRSLKKDIEIFREENIPLYTEITTEQQKYAQISGAMTVEIDGQEKTLQQASVLLMSTDRKKREEVYHKITNRRLKDKSELDDLFTRLIKLRDKVATNAGFKNFRDYMFKSLGRFDYTPQDCFNFHQSIQSGVVPILNDFARERKQALKVDALRPWDKAVDPEGKDPLKAFSDGQELTNKTIECFYKLDPYLGQCLSIMKEMGHLDLESRKGKAPGGYNYPLSEIGVPFIFMNATSTLRDMVTIMHEGGHAIHNFLTRELELNDFKSTPSEVAELASMSMELISMDHWDIFFTNPDDLKRAKREHLEDLIETLPWVATIDKYQHWLYENPGHSLEERRQNWNWIFDEFSDSVTNWSGLQEAKDYLWQKQLHLYEVPFYYIEYGMAQLGAIAVWRNYRADKQKGLQGYMNALKLGYMKSIPEVYQAANIKFDFSRNYIQELMDFVKKELAAIG